jgi:Cysteine-rich secretory protein family/FG-GAP-like repeat/FG-GAP repeat
LLLAQTISIEQVKIQKSFLMAQPTAQEQQMLELINRMRQAPAAELNLLINSGDPDINGALSFFGVNTTTLAQQWAALSPTSPLAWSSQLSDASLLHNQQMIAANVQSHQVAGEPGLDGRANNAGYTGWSNLGENIFAYGKSVFSTHGAFAIDWGYGPGGIQIDSGHRTNMMSSAYREVGIGITPSTGTGNGVTTGPLVVTEDFGNRSALSGKAWLLGVAFKDFDRDNFYDPGEGLGGITVQILKTGTSTPILATTLDAGGYQALLDPGQYQLSFLQNNLLLKSESITVDAQNPVNIKRDLVLSPNQVKNDFGGDKKSDILWRNSNGQVYSYQMNGLNVASEASLGGVSTDWQIAGTGDFNGDGKSDILWRNTTSGLTYGWKMNGNTKIGEGTIGTVGNDWQIAGTGDFNGDGKADILWRNTTSGLTYGYLMNDLTVAGEGAIRTVGNDWQVAGTGDFNGDGKSDILWRNTNSGLAYVYLMNGVSVIGEGAVRQVSNDWVVEGVDDFNNDGKSDILWRNTISGAAHVYEMNGASILAEGGIGTVGLDWNIAGTGDYNGDAKADILWRNNNGLAYLWTMDGFNKLGDGAIRQVDNSWSIAAPTL